MSVVFSSPLKQPDSYLAIFAKTKNRPSLAKLTVYRNVLPFSDFRKAPCSTFETIEYFLQSFIANHSRAHPFVCSIKEVVDLQSAIYRRKLLE